MAMGMLVVPTWKRLMNASTPGTKYPAATPTAIARKIHSVRKRSRVERRRELLDDCVGIDADRLAMPNSFWWCAEFSLPVV